MTTLAQQREDLMMEVKYGTNPESFPGSADWHKAQAAKKALADFDAAHPEIKAEAQAKAAAESAARKGRYLDNPASHYNRAIRMED